MAKEINQAFTELKTNLEPTGLQKEIISQRQANVRSVLEAGLTVVDTFLTGSYSRNTLIGPLNQADIDIFAILDPRFYNDYNGKNNGQAGLLDLVKRTLRKTYTRTPDISRNGQAVTIQFDDFKVDVVPAFNRQGGGYIIANSVSQKWLSTDPKKHIDIFSQANKAHNGDLVPLIKMLKAWNRNNDRYFNSFHLEVLALDILNNVTITDFPSGVRYYLDKGRELVTKKNLDPAGYGEDIGGYINTQDKIREAGWAFQVAYDIAIRAESHNSLGNSRQAIEDWRQIFGTYFPSYG